VITKRVPVSVPVSLMENDQRMEVCAKVVVKWTSPRKLDSKWVASARKQMGSVNALRMVIGTVVVMEAV
jgi:hypothetical protein